MSEAKLKLAIDGVQGVVGGLDKVGSKLGSVSKSIAGLSAIGGSLSVGAFAAFIKTQINAADRLGDLSVATNITVEDLTGLEWAAQMSGTGLEDVAKSVNRLAVEMGRDAEKFARLGVTAKEPLEAFLQLTDVLNRIEDPQKRAAVANAAFGRSYEQLAPLLAEGSEKIRTLMERGKELSGVTTEMSGKAGKFNDDIDELKKQATKLGIEIADKMLPGLTNVTSAMTQAAKESGLLKAAWVGLGGIAAEVFGDSLDQQIKFAEGNIKHLQAVINNPGAWRKFTDMMGGETTKKNREELERQKEILAGLLTQKAALAAPALTQFDEKKTGTKPDTSGFIKDEDGKAYDAAIKKSEDFIEAIQKETALVGATTEQKKMHEAEQIASTLRLSGANAAYVEKFLAGTKEYIAALVKVEDAEEIRKQMLKFSDDLVTAGGNQVESIQDQLRAQREQNAEIGLTTEQLAELTAGRIEDEAAADRELAANMRAAAAYAGPLHDAYIQYAADLEKAAAAKDALADEKRIGASRQAFVDAEKKAADEAKQIWENFTENVQSNVGDVLYDGLSGKFDDIGDTFSALIKRMVADAAAADLMNLIMPGSAKGGFASTFGAIGNGLLGIFGGSGVGGYSDEMSRLAAQASMPGFDGGGYTGNGPRSGGIDGKGGFPAILHPQETVIDHSRGQSMGGTRISVTYSPTINIDSRTDRAEVQALVEKSMDRAVQVGNAKLVDDLHRAGKL